MRHVTDAETDRERDWRGSCFQSEDQGLGGDLRLWNVRTVVSRGQCLGGSVLGVTLCPQCYMFHMYVGVRAGGGIGDEIEDPAGDEYEIYRIIFDITFFFFVIVILLAIIQGNCLLTGTRQARV